MTAPEQGPQQGLLDDVPTAATGPQSPDPRSLDPHRTTPDLSNPQPSNAHAGDPHAGHPVGSAGSPTPGGSRVIVRSALEALAGVVLAVAAVLLTRNGIRTDDFPPFLAGTSATPITRYSGPWLTAGAAAALLAALLLLLSVIGLIRWSRDRRRTVPPDTPASGSVDVTGPTSS